MIKVPNIQVVFTFLAVLVLAAAASFFLGVHPFGIGLNSCGHVVGNMNSDVTDVSLRRQVTLQWNSSSSEGTLSSILKAAAMPNKTVIIAPLNGAWAAPGSLLDLFLESFHIGIGTKALLRHLVIVAVDPKAYSRCKLVHPYCFFLKTPGVDFAEEKAFMTEGYLKLVWRKIDYLGMILELGYSFVFTDVDIMWLRDPFPDLQQQQKRNNGVDIFIACDAYNGNPKDVRNRVNTGFTYVRANYRTTAFYRHWYKARKMHPKLHDQDVFNIIKGDEFVNMLGLKIRFLDTTYYAGFCEQGKDPRKLRTMHANCCVGLHNKLSDLRLVLDDWANFTTSHLSQATSKDNGSGGGGRNTNFPWRFPTARKCKIN